MEKTTIKVEGMSCMHCVKAVTGAVNELPGINDVSVDLEAKTVTVQYDAAQASIERIKAQIEDQGYDIVG